MPAFLLMQGPQVTPRRDGAHGAEGTGQQEGSAPQRHCCTHPSPTSEVLWKRQQAACPKSTVHLSPWFPCLPGALTARCTHRQLLGGDVSSQHHVLLRSPAPRHEGTSKLPA